MGQDHLMFPALRLREMNRNISQEALAYGSAGNSMY